MTSTLLKQYLWLHRYARLSEADWQSVCDGSVDEADRLGGRQP